MSSEDGPGGVSLEKFLRVHSLEDLDNLTADALMCALDETNATTIKDHTVLSNLADYQIFEARSKMSRTADRRDQAWWFLDCWGSNIVANEGLCHLRSRILQFCVECVNNVALCANALSLFEIDWYVLSESRGYRLCSDDGSMYRRPDVALAVKLRYFGVKPLLIMDVFTRDSSFETVRESAENWLNNWSSIQTVVSMQVTVENPNSEDESQFSDLGDGAAPMTKTVLPKSCTTRVSIWERDASGKANESSPRCSYGGTINSVAGPDFGSDPRPLMANLLPLHLSGMNRRLDRFSIDEDFPLGSGPCRKGSNVNKGDSTAPAEGLLDHPATPGGGTLRKEGKMRYVASCATLATVPSESDFLQTETNRVTASVVIEANTALSFTAADSGLGLHIPGFMCINGKTSFHVSMVDLESSQVMVSTDCSGTSLSRSRRPRNSEGATSDNAADLMITVPLSKLSSSILRSVSYNEVDCDKAQVVRLSINPDRLIRGSVLVGLNRDLCFKYRSLGSVAIPG